KLNPYLQTTIRYKIISLVSKIQAASGAESKAAVSKLEKQRSENRNIFSPHDEWLAGASKILSYAQREQEEALRAKQRRQQQEREKDQREREEHQRQLD